MDPFRGPHGLEERERLLFEEKRSLELELENLRRLAPPLEARAAGRRGPSSI